VAGDDGRPGLCWSHLGKHGSFHWKREQVLVRHIVESFSRTLSNEDAAIWRHGQVPEPVERNGEAGGSPPEQKGGRTQWRLFADAGRLQIRLPAEQGHFCPSAAPIIVTEQGRVCCVLCFQDLSEPVVDTGFSALPIEMCFVSSTTGCRADCFQLYGWSAEREEDWKSGREHPPATPAGKQVPAVAIRECDFRSHAVVPDK
jgi:hypothetical protein